MRNKMSNFVLDKYKNEIYIFINIAICHNCVHTETVT